MEKEVAVSGGGGRRRNSSRYSSSCSICKRLQDVIANDCTRPWVKEALVEAGTVEYSMGHLVSGLSGSPISDSKPATLGVKGLKGKLSQGPRPKHF